MVRGTGITTSLLIIAIGAVLAFAVNLDGRGIDLNAVGGILIVVGLIGLLFSLVALGEFDLFGARPHHDDYVREGYDDDVTPPHTHRRADTHDVVVEDEGRPPRTERVRRIRR